MIDPKVIADSIRSGHKVLICGNGGLAAEAEHFAAELMGKFAFESYFPCIALTTNSALITALSNDMGFENVFSHQVEVLGCEGDILIGMTTSASKNILKALEAGEKKGMKCFLINKKFLEPQFGYDHRQNYIGPVPDPMITAEIQNYAIEYLHNLAYEIKRELSADRQPQ